MDDPWLLVLGSVVVVFTLVDLVITTLAVGAGRGPMSNRVAAAVRWAGHAGTTSHGRLRWVGILGAALVPAMWTLLLWTGFTLMFLADNEAVLDSVTQQPTSALGRVAFAAGGLAGAGAGLIAGSEAWQLVNNVSALIGLAVVTLGLTYLFQVVTSVKKQRSTASHIAGLGPSPSSTVAAAMRQQGLGTLPLQIVNIAENLSSVAQGHRALPLLQFFHGGQRDTSPAVNLARFDEVLSLLEHAAPGNFDDTVTAGRSAVDSFLRSIQLPATTSHPPPLPELGPLREVAEEGIPDDGEFAARMENETERRCRLWTYVNDELWDWDEVHGSGARED